MKVTDDFKMVIVIDESLPTGLKANTAAVLSLTLGGKIEGLLGHDLKDQVGFTHTALTKYPLPILKTNIEKLKRLCEQCRDIPELLFIDITDAAQTTVNYQDYEDKLKSTSTAELKILGIALAGSEKLVRKFTGSFGLMRE